MQSKAPAILLLLGGLLLLAGDRIGPIADWIPIAGKAPIEAPGFRVMLVYDDVAVSKMSEAAKAVIFSSEIRTFLNENVEKVDGKPDYRFVTNTTDMTKDKPYWIKAADRPRPKNPWLMINGKKSGGFEGQAPDNPEAMMALLKKHAGAK